MNTCPRASLDSSIGVALCACAWWSRGAKSNSVWCSVRLADGLWAFLRCATSFDVRRKVMGYQQTTVGQVVQALS
ncbi:hypothetical protein CLOM_g12963 [Closterium sp. NIES-68]|nr:hypothetical protein CLOM_g12963 [Closterium sp. NIES-68]GJP61155.1 hypothetical protein CLOP_g18354 [Closterium sp. NIES-67]